jgi:ketosteroid isomerase-like protein
MVRVPSAYGRLAALVWRWLSPRSRLRRALLRRILDTGWSSIDRRDFELNVVMFAPDAEFELPAELHALGLDPSYHGRAGRVKGVREWLEAWEFTELQPAYLLDLGDRVLILGFWHNRARASGVNLTQSYAQLITVSNGLVARDQNFLSWEEGLRAAGLEPDAVALPKGATTGAPSTSG